MGVQMIGAKLVKSFVDEMHNIYIIGENGEYIQPKYISFENITLKAFRKRYPEKNPEELVTVCKTYKKNGRTFYNIVHTSCYVRKINVDT